MRLLIGLAVLLASGLFAAAQVKVVKVEKAYIVNKTGKTIRFVISSEQGVHTQVLPNDTAVATYFAGKRTRVITVYERGQPEAPPLVNEEIDLEANAWYEIEASATTVRAAERTIKKKKDRPAGTKLEKTTMPETRP